MTFPLLKKSLKVQKVWADHIIYEITTSNSCSRITFLLFFCLAAQFKFPLLLQFDLQQPLAETKWLCMKIIIQSLSKNQQILFSLFNVCNRWWNVKYQPRLEPRASGVTCQHSNHWATYSPFHGRNSSLNLRGEFYEWRKCCETCYKGVTVRFVRWAQNVTGGEKSSPNRNSNPGPLAYRASTLTTEILRPKILTNSHTPVNSVRSCFSLTSLSPFILNSSNFSWHLSSVFMCWKDI